ncbi:cytochrome P450 [Streptomyces sp. NPDC038707]|uniref:cytochrome P450 n=1 Tax=Streptomyces sp. NPDC038707 TaxID=3154329 RepID=UPI0033EEFB24
MTEPVPLSGTSFLAESDLDYRALRREHGAVVPVVLDGGVPAWLVIDYQELHQVTGDPVLFSRDFALWNQWQSLPDDWPLLPMILRQFPPDPGAGGRHIIERKAALNSSLDGVDLFRLRRDTEYFADELINAVCASGRADLVTDYAKLLPMRVLAVLFGFPEEDGPALVAALNDMVDGNERAAAGMRHLAAATAGLVAAQRRRPGDGLVGRMLAADTGFTDEHVMHDLLEIAAAAHQPVADWISHSLRLMLTDDRFAASLFGGRNSVAEAMNEVLWEEAPVQIVSGRWAARDTLLAERHIRAGDLLLLGFQAANNDPYVRTHQSAPTGGNHAHFAFGHGEHRCPFAAQEMAEVMARTAIEVVLDRLPDIDLAVPAESLTRRPSPWLRGLTSLPVVFTPSPAPRSP